ncbi:hypothetical protein DL95DRAFT_484282 [Leptodontidium sp. 2 PMI_412]|nr:hypothetical protein DL95DRAFT_484282 [Leptodontidium sp. 2 PMI_412]
MGEVCNRTAKRGLRTLSREVEIPFISYFSHLPFPRHSLFLKPELGNFENRKGIRKELSATENALQNLISTAHASRTHHFSDNIYSRDQEPHATMSFGWSAGDIANAITLIVKLIQALDDAEGSAGDYRKASIAKQVEHIKEPVKRFLEAVLKYEPSLGLGAAEGRHRNVLRKVQWYLFMNRKVLKLRDSIDSHMRIIDSELKHLTFVDVVYKIEHTLPDSLRAIVREALPPDLMTLLRDHLSTIDARILSQIDTAQIASHDRVLSSLDGQYQKLFVNIDFLKQQLKITNITQERIELCLRRGGDRKLVTDEPPPIDQTTRTDRPFNMLPKSDRRTAGALSEMSLLAEPFMMQDFVECEFSNLPGATWIKKGRYMVSRLADHQALDAATWARLIVPGSKVEMSIVIRKQLKSGTAGTVAYCPENSCLGSWEMTGEETWVTCPDCQKRVLVSVRGKKTTFGIDASHLLPSKTQGRVADSTAPGIRSRRRGRPISDSGLANLNYGIRDLEGSDVGSVFDLDSESSICEETPVDFQLDWIYDLAIPFDHQNGVGSDPNQDSGSESEPDNEDDISVFKRIVQQLVPKEKAPFADKYADWQGRDFLDSGFDPFDIMIEDDLESAEGLPPSSKFSHLLQVPVVSSSECFLCKPDEAKDVMTDKAHAINMWLLSALRSSSLQVLMLERIFLAYYGNIDRYDRWQIDVLSCWYQDVTSSLYMDYFVAYNGLYTYQQGVDLESGRLQIGTLEPLLQPSGLVCTQWVHK